MAFPFFLSFFLFPFSACLDRLSTKGEGKKKQKKKKNGKVVKVVEKLDFPTDTSTTLELQNPSLDVSDLHKIFRSPDLEALKLEKGRSGREER